MMSPKNNKTMNTDNRWQEPHTEPNTKKQDSFISDVISIWKQFCQGLGYMTFTLLVFYYVFGGRILVEINMIESWQILKSWFGY